MLSLQQMQYILSLNETKHFQRASDLCFVTQPTLSMQLKKAEDTLGYAIFDRSRQPLELTNFGEKLIPIIREIVNENEKIDLITKQMKNDYKERVTIGIIPTIADYMVPALHANWIKKINDTQLLIKELKTEELIAALEKKELDVIIMAGPYHNNRYKTSPLFLEEILAFSPVLEENNVTTEELSNLQPWLLSSGNCLRNQMIQFCQLSNEFETTNFSYEGGNTDLLIKMVEINGGYTLIPKNHPLSKEQKNDLKRIHAEGFTEHPAREVIAVYPQKSMKWGAIEKIIREIQHKYAKKSDDKFEILSWN